MGQVIHYQDDIFLIDSLIGFVADAANLEADADILGETVLSVIQKLIGPSGPSVSWFWPTATSSTGTNT